MKFKKYMMIFIFVTALFLAFEPLLPYDYNLAVIIRTSIQLIGTFYILRKIE